jgi:hypothetical protein
VRKYILLLLFPLITNANCFYDAYGNATCINTQPYVSDFRNDTNSPQIYENGQYRGNLNNNRFDPNSVSNPYGRYGSPYSSESVNNPYRPR